MAHTQRVKQAKLAALRRRRVGGRPSSRLARTILLGTVAVAFALAWLVREFGLDVQELLSYLGVSALFVLGVAGCGLVGFGVLWLVRRLGARWR